MQSYLLAGPTPMDASAAPTPNRDLSISHSSWPHHRNGSRRFRATAAAGAGGKKNHYAVLGVSPDSSSGDIKKAYRALALKYHPDVSKDSQADEVFKNIRLAYDTLSNQVTRNQYDKTIQFEEDTRRSKGHKWDYNLEFEDGVRVYRWADFRQRMRRERYWKQQNAREDNSTYYETDEETEEGIVDEERGPFIEVIRSTLLSLFLLKTVGARLSLTLSSLLALLDEKLDNGYKMGYAMAWLVGGKGGILLTLCLSFASWVCGKTSSSLVALVVVAMWIGSNLARFAPIPQGALLTLVYMSIKLQADLN